VRLGEPRYKSRHSTILAYSHRLLIGGGGGGGDLDLSLEYDLALLRLRGGERDRELDAGLAFALRPAGGAPLGGGEREGERALRRGGERDMDLE